MALALCLAASFAAWAGGSKESGAAATTGGKGPSWIADRLIKGRIFLENDGEALPKDQINNLVAQRIKELTGITLSWQSTGASSGIEELTLALATQDIPEVIENYLDHGGRPEMAVILKAAREGMFLDLKPYLEKTKVYSKYLTDPRFAPKDTINNVMLRPEFGGKVYFVHMNIPASDRKDSDRLHYRFGLFMREDIAQSVGVDLAKMASEDDLYNALVKVKNGSFKDANDKVVSPLGPRFWGGSWMATLVRNFDFGNGTRFDVDKDGKVKHVIETDYAWKQVEFYRKLVAANLIHPEYFTMDDARTREALTNGSFAVTPWFAVGNRSVKMKYVPFNLANWKGEKAEYEKDKSAGQTWAISSKTKNPEEIVKFADFLAGREGKLLWYYGIEGQQYTLKNGNPIQTADWKKYARENADKTKDVVPTFWGGLLGSTWLNHNRDFSELSVGLNSLDPGSDEEKGWQRQQYEAAFGNPTFKYWEGFSAVSYISDVPDIESRLQPVLTEYPDIMVKAVYAKSDAEARAVLDGYKDALKKSGLDDFKAFLQGKYDKDKGSVVFYMDATY
jgi:putative aldouronate transport system substrate-binding protein